MNNHTYFCVLICCCVGCKPDATLEPVEKQYVAFKKELESGTIEVYDTIQIRLSLLRAAVTNTKPLLKPEQFPKADRLLAQIQKDSLGYRAEQLEYDGWQTALSTSSNLLARLKRTDDFIAKHPKVIPMKAREAKTDSLTRTFRDSIQLLSALDANMLLWDVQNRISPLLEFLGNRTIFQSTACDLKSIAQQLKQGNDAFQVAHIAFPQSQASIKEARFFLRQLDDVLKQIQQKYDKKIQDDIQLQLFDNATDIQEGCCSAVKSYRASKWAIKVPNYYTCQPVSKPSNQTIEMITNKVVISQTYRITTMGFTRLEKEETENVTVLLTIPYENCELGTLTIGKPVVARMGPQRSSRSR